MFRSSILQDVMDVQILGYGGPRRYLRARAHLGFPDELVPISRLHVEQNARLDLL